jgi:uncharacterized oligopeptide transporter (OPT) family protein
MNAKNAIPPEDEFEFEEESAKTQNPPIPSSPGDVPEDDRAEWWLKNVYQGDLVPQLSCRAIVSGMLIGGIMSISNLYVGLKAGWGLGVTITACIIAYAVFSALEAVVPAYRKRPFSILENLTMTSAASAAGYISTASLASSIPALYLATGRVLLWWEMMLWIASVATLGVFMAVPLKRQLINIDQLPFPSGIATAETLKSIHTAGRDAIHKARALFSTALFGALVKLWQEGLPAFADWLGNHIHNSALSEKLAALALPSTFPLYPGGQDLLKRLTFGFEGSTFMIGAGAIMGIRVGVSLLIGAVVYYGIIGHILTTHKIVDPQGGYRAIVAWTLWPATAMMITSGLLAFAMRWRTVLRAFGEIAALFGHKTTRKDPLAHVEVPASWFLSGVCIAGASCIALGMWRFGIAWWMGLLAVLLTFLLSIVAARATGETDFTPIGAMGKITQLTYGIIAPTSITTNLMTAAITAGGASHSADLLTDLKSGYLLGSNPRKQTIAQLFGVLAGVLFCVPIYSLVVKTPPKAETAATAQDTAHSNPAVHPQQASIEQTATAQTNLGTEQFPAPSAKVWAAVAEMLKKGFSALPYGTPWAMLVGGAIGIAITLAEEFLPHRYTRWLPSATGLGVAGVVPAFNSISMFLGALIAWLWTKSNAASADKYVISTSAGLIAGESLMGVALILWGQAWGLFASLMR